MLGGHGRVLTSSDGTTWKTRESHTERELGDVEFGASGFVAVGHAGAVLSSADAVTWTPRSTPLSDVSWTGIAFASGLIVAVGNVEGSRGGYWTRSSDGATWFR